MSTLNRKSTRNKSKGLGDTIEQITKATGIDKAVKFIAGDDCGCEERKEKLNKIFPYKQPLCMTESEYEWWGQFRDQNSTNISPMELDMISDIYQRIFQLRKKYRPCTCNPREWQRLINELNAVYNTYE